MYCMSQSFIFLGEISNISSTSTSTLSHTESQKMTPCFRSMLRRQEENLRLPPDQFTSPLIILIIVNLRQSNESLRTTEPDIQSTKCLSGVQCAGDQRCSFGHEVTGHHISMAGLVFRGTEIIGL